MQNCPSPAAVYSGFDVIVVASSLGGPAALARILSVVPADFPAGIVVAQHVSAISSPCVIQHLNRASTLPVSTATDDEPIAPGRVYLAPPDHHLLITLGRRLSLTRGPKVKFCRPAAEPLFATAAGTYRERTLGLVLTGCNTDGAVGAQTIKWMGGRVLVQDPLSARAPAMPKAAIAAGAVDYVLPLEKIADALIALVMVRGVAEYLRVVPTAA